MKENENKIKDMLQILDNELIIAIIKGKVPVVNLAIQELKNRGIDLNGKYVGFNR